MATNSTTLPSPADEPLLALPEDTDASSNAASGWQAKLAERPLISVGAGLIGGMILGGLTGGGDDRRDQRRYDRRAWSDYDRYRGSHESSGQGQDGNQGSSAGIATSMTEGLRKAAKQSGLEEHGRSTSTSLMSSLNDSLRSALSGQLPEFDQKLKDRQDEQRG